MKTAYYFLLLSLNWIPRILCILLAVFISLFAMDVFGQGTGLVKTIIALLAHMIPTFLIIAILILSWKWAWVGGIYIIFAIAYIIRMEGDYQIIYIPLIITGSLFLASWFLRKEIRKALEIYRE